MKINATLVKEDGLCYGMVMPEKPKYCSWFPNGECLDAKSGLHCNCAVQRETHHAALQVGKDAAVRYEDQEAMNKMLYFALPDESIKDYKAKPGVYPLPEPLEVETDLADTKIKSRSMAGSRP